MDSNDVLGMCTTDNKWNVAGKFGFYGEFFLFHCKKEPTVEFGHSLDTPRVKCEETSIFEQDSISAGCGYFERPLPCPSLVMCMDEKGVPFRRNIQGGGLEWGVMRWVTNDSV